MNSKMLLHMLDDMSKHHRKRKDLLPEYVNARLDKSLKSYYEELISSYDALIRKDAAKVLRVMNKEDNKR